MEVGDYINQIGIFFEKSGLNLTQGRILGLLLISDPPQLNITQISEHLAISKSTASTSVSRLTEIGLLERAPVPSARGDFYAVSESLWTRTLDSKADASTVFIHIANTGLELLKEESLERKQRLLEIKLLFEFIESELPKLMAKYRAFRNGIKENGKIPEKYLLGS